MSLYREAGSRKGRTLAVLTAVLVVGGLIGFGVGWALKPQPTLQDRIEDVQAEVEPALDGLELVPIHYESTNPVTKRAASEQLVAAKEDLDDAADDLRALDPAGAAQVTASLAARERLLDHGASSAEVDAAVRQLARQVREAARID